MLKTAADIKLGDTIYWRNGIDIHLYGVVTKITVPDKNTFVYTFELDNNYAKSIRMQPFEYFSKKYFCPVNEDALKLFQNFLGKFKNEIINELAVGLNNLFNGYFKPDD